MNVAGPCQASRRCRKDATIAMRQRLAANDRRPRPVWRSDTVPRLKSNADRVETSELRTPGEPWKLARCRAFSWVEFRSGGPVWKLARLIGWRAILVQPEGGSVSI